MLFYISDLSSAMLSQGCGAAFVLSPSSGVLSPFGEEVIEVSAYSDMWGEYMDSLICRVSIQSENDENLFNWTLHKNIFDIIVKSYNWHLTLFWVS